MKSLILIAIALCLGFTSGTLRRNAPWSQNSAEEIGPEALWQPGMQIMQTIREKCASARSFGGCFVSEMRQAGATPQAVAFTKMTGNTGYLRDFREAGRVDVAYVYYPFRANENQGCLLVNGSPQMIDVDDFSSFPKEELQRNSDYAALARKYPNVMIFPGDRSGTSYPRMEKLSDGGQRFAVNYRLMNGCHACEVVGAATLAFDFDPAGKFLGRRLISIGPPPAGARSPGDDNKSEQHDSSAGGSAQTLEEQVGRVFVLRLDSNHTTGYRWELARPLDQTKLVLVGTQYKPSDSRLTGAGGEEVWRFKAVGAGRASIEMRYVRPWEKDVAPAQTKSFAVILK